MMDDNGMVVGQNNIMNINGQTLPPGVYKNENGQFKRLEGDDAKAETARLGSEFEKLKAGQRDGQHLGFEGESGNDLVNMTSNPPGMMTRTMSDGTVQLAKDFAQGYRDQNATRQLYAGASHASGAPTAPAAGTPSNGPIIEADYSEVPNNGPDYAGMSAEADENGGGTPASPKATPLIPQPEGPVPKQRALPAPPKQAGPANP